MSSQLHRGKIICYPLDRRSGGAQQGENEPPGNQTPVAQLQLVFMMGIELQFTILRHNSMKQSP
jgi:hypothetical protein